jgi:hypothetical protein
MRWREAHCAKCEHEREEAMPLVCLHHFLVDQLRFARCRHTSSELVRCLKGVSDEDARRRLGPVQTHKMNCISWIIGHLASQENGYWVWLAQGADTQGERLEPGLDELAGWGSPPNTPPLDEMWAAWGKITTAADRYLDTLTPEVLLTHLERDGKRHPESVGTMLMRNIYHYWFHIGEAHAIRQQLGHSNLPQFVGNMSQAVYRPER